MTAVSGIPWSEADQTGSIVARFERVADACSDRIALHGPSGAMTYRTLLDRARRVARGMSDAGGWPGEPVALVFDHDTPSIVAILAALMAGRPYVALDPAVPASRHRHVLDDLRPVAIVAEGRHLEVAAGYHDADVPVLAYETLLDGEGVPASLDGGPDSVAGIFYTSGTTGRPKGVIRTHRTILHRTMLDSVDADFGPADTFSLLYSTSFGTSVNDIFSALLNGGTLAIRDVLASGVASTAAWVADQPITVLHAQISLMRRLVDAMEPGRRHPDLRVMIPSGRLYAADIRRFFEHLPADAVIVSRYSSTETTLVARYTIGANTALSEGIVPIGRPVGDKQVRIERADGTPADTGEVGEIVVSSRFLSPGYWGDDTGAETELAVPDPDRPGFYLYHTGDYGRVRDDGLLEFVGRKDDRVKIRGYRVEIEDVVAAIHGIDGVREVAVRAVTAGDTDQLVAYLVLDESMSTSDVRRTLESSLPAYMVPAFVVQLPELPLTAAGKVDGNALPPPSGHRPELQTGYVEPRTETESAIAEIWSDVLGITGIGIRDRFLDLGGDSLRAMRIIGRVLTRFGVDLPVRSLLDAGTVEAMSATVVEATGRDDATTIGRRPDGAVVPVTAGQMAIWLAEQFGSGSGAYNMPKLLELSGRLDTTALGRAIDHIVERHATLRTTFHLDGERVVQRIHPPPGDLLEIVDADDEDAVDELASEIAGRPFDLAADIPFRARLIRIMDGEALLVVVSHHIVSDRESSRILLGELADAYRAFVAGDHPDLPALPVEYADFAVWRSETVDSDEIERQVGYWVERLRSSPPSDGSLVAPGAPTRLLRERRAFGVDPTAVAAVDRFASAAGVSRFVAIVALFALAVRRATSQSAVTIGTTVSGRSRPELEPLIGYLASLLAIPIDLPSDDLTSIVETSGRAVADALDHSDAPFDQVVARLAPERHRGRLPLVDVVVNYDRRGPEVYDFGDVGATRRRLRMEQARAPLVVDVRASAESLSVKVDFDPGLVQTAVGERLVEELQAAFSELT